MVGLAHRASSEPSALQKLRGCRETYPGSRSTGEWTGKEQDALASEE